MSELVIIQQSRFNEILKEELEAIKKQLTEAQINLLCGPSASVKAALNESSRLEDKIYYSPDSTLAAVHAIISSTDSFKQNLANNPDATFDELYDRNDMWPDQPHEMRKAEYLLTRIWLEMEIRQPWRQGLNFETIGDGSFSFDNNRSQYQGMFRAWLLRIPVGNGNAWDDVVDPVARFQNEETLADLGHVADITGLTALRDFISDSVVFEVVRVLALAGGSLALLFGGAPVWATVLTAAVIATIIKAFAEVSKSNYDEATRLFTEALFALPIFRLGGALGNSNFVATIARSVTAFFRRMLGMPQAAVAEPVRLLVVQAQSNLTKLLAEVTVDVALFETVVKAVEDGQATIPIRYNYTDDEYGNAIKNRYWRPSRQTRADAEDDARTAEAEDDTLAVAILNGEATADAEGVTVLTGPNSGKNHAAARQNDGLDDWITPEILASFGPNINLQEGKTIKNTNNILTESRFQKLAGI
jgi:hypothetical protein